MATTDHEYFMRQALGLAREAEARGEVPVGAILVGPGGDVLGRGGNSPISCSDPTAHAEIVAIRDGAARVGNYRLPGTTLYVTIEPCPMCAGAIIQARISCLVFGAKDPKGGACGSLYNLVDDIRLNHRVEIVSGILEEEARGLIQGFFKRRRKKSGEVPKRP